jgi:AcrR family transcriptional regulator
MPSSPRSCRPRQRCRTGLSGLPTIGSQTGIIRRVADTSGGQVASLRERKKAQTRRLLIDAAVELCLTQGYENTTVEQIAEIVEVSPRTFSRYFSSKDAVFIAVLDDLAEEIVEELNAQPTGIGPMEALRAAHVAVLSRVSAQRPLAGLTVERIMLILRVVYASEALRQAAIEYRSPAAMAALARHMGVPVDDRRLELAVALFSTTIVSACRDVFASDPGGTHGPDVVMQRLEQALSEVAQFTAELRLP